MRAHSGSLHVRQLNEMTTRCEACPEPATHRVSIPLEPTERGPEYLQTCLCASCAAAFIAGFVLDLEEPEEER